MSKLFQAAYITDVQADGVHNTWRYISNTYDENSFVIEGLLLFPDRTARTNVAFKGVDGKFISFRDLEDQNVKAAVELLAPFPAGDR